MKKHTAALSLFLLTACCSINTQANSLVLPDTEEAQQAFLNMMGLPDSIAKEARVKLGTCISALEAEYPGQIACTVAVTIGAGTSEAQADFYQTGQQWAAQQSNSQDRLPFPDPKLR